MFPETSKIYAQMQKKKKRVTEEDPHNNL